jgi:hypothetical protein
MRKPAKQRDEERKNRVLEVCFVCGNTIKDKSVFVGQEKYRHIRCQPGGARWMKSTRAKESLITEFFDGVKHE